MTGRTWRGLLVAWLAAGALAGCGGPPPPVDGPLSGTWLVTTTAGQLDYFGSENLVTLAFSGADAGTAALRALREASGATACGTLVFAVDGDTLWLSSPRFFDASFDLVLVDDDTATIANADVAATLTRAVGAGPVPACGEATSTIAATLPFLASTRGTLTAHGSTLYLNVDDDAGTIVGYDLATDTLGAGRVHTMPTLGGVHRWLVGVRDDARFFGNCSCGGGTTLAAFDLDADLVLASVDTTTTASVPFEARWGEFDGSSLLVGGSVDGGGTGNRMVRADPDSLAFSDERDVLDDLGVIDVALDGADLYALAYLPGGPAIVAVGPDGRATATYPLPDLYFLQTVGITAIDGTLYVAASDYYAGTTVVLEVELP